MTEPITPRRAAMVLARASGIDMRNPDAAADELWSQVLTAAGVAFEDAMAAVTIHYGRSTDRLMPAHVVAIARDLARDRTANTAARQAIEAYDLPDVVDPRTVAPRIVQMLADARARVAARAAEGHAGAPERLGGGYGHPVPLRTGRDVLSGPVRQACQNDRDHAGGDWCLGWLIFDGWAADAACDTCGARSGIYASTDPSCPRQDGWTWE